MSKIRNILFALFIVLMIGVSFTGCATTEISTSATVCFDVEVPVVMNGDTVRYKQSICKTVDAKLDSGKIKLSVRQ